MKRISSELPEAMAETDDLLDRSPQPALWLALLICTALGTWVSFHVVNTGFRYYDDEGLILNALIEFESGRVLYDELTTQYGSGFFLLCGALKKLGIIEFTQDGMRQLTAVLWVLGSVLYGLVVFRTTKRTPAACASCLLTFFAAIGLTNEPGHPQCVLFVLVGGLLLLSTFFPNLRAAFAFGVLAAFTCFVKVNIGGLAVLGGCWALTCVNQTSRTLISTRRVAAASILMVPIVLTRQSWASSKVVAYLIIGIAAIACLLITTNSITRPETRGNHRSILAALFGGIVASVLTLAWTLQTGVSLGGVWTGLVAQHLQFATQFWVWPPIPTRWLIASTVVAVTVSWWIRRSRNPWAAISRIILQLACGSGIIIGLLNQWSLLPYLIPWSFLMASCHRSLDVSRRLGLVTITVLMYWQAYPVAGTQWMLVAASMAPLGIVLLSDGLRDLSERCNFPQAMAHRSVFGAICLLLCFTVTRMGASASQAFSSLPASLELSGARMLRAPETQLAALEGVTWNLKQNGSSLFALPGLYSFCGWTGLRSATPLTQTNWPQSFSDKQQRQIVTDITAANNVLLLKSESNVEFWSRSETLPDGPAVRFAGSDFQDRIRVDRYVIGARPHEPFRWIGAAANSSNSDNRIEIQLPVLHESIFAIDAWDTETDQPVLLENCSVLGEPPGATSPFDSTPESTLLSTDHGLDLSKPRRLTVRVNDAAHSCEFPAIVFRFYAKNGTVRIRLPMVELIGTGEALSNVEGRDQPLLPHVRFPSAPTSGTPVAMSQTK